MSSKLEALKKELAEKNSTPMSSSTVSQETPTTKSSKLDTFKKEIGQTGRKYTPKVEEPGMLENMAKGLVSATATQIARPLQAAAVIAGVPNEEINKYNLGGIIAPVPTGEKGIMSDVTKEIGRSGQSIALGLGGAPIAAGAMFGAGSSLERQGTDAFTTPGGAGSLALETGIGMVGGKLLDKFGAPIIQKVGNVAGKVVPQSVINAGGKVVEKVGNYMDETQLFGRGKLGAISEKVTKPLSEKITSGAMAFDKGVNTATSKVAGKAKTLFQEQYPGAKGENIAKHFEDLEVDRLFKPTEDVSATFNKAKDIYKDAERRKIDLKQAAKNNKIYAEDYVVDGKFSTADASDALEKEAMMGGRDILRPALSEAEQIPGFTKVPISDIRSKIAQEIWKTPNAKMSVLEKENAIRAMAKEYADGTATAAKYADGYNLTDLYDAKLQTSQYKPGKMGGVQTIADNLTSQRKQIESKIFDKYLRMKAPADIGLDDYFKAQEAKFQLANYLKSLDTKNAPKTLFQRALRRTAQLSGATAGAQVAGPFGMFSGYQFGGVVSDTFMQASNPVKVAYLRSIGKAEPEIFAIMKDFATKNEIIRAMALPAPKDTSGIDPVKSMLNDIKQNTTWLNSTKALPAPNPNVIIPPNMGGTPNVPGAPFPANQPVGGMGQRIPMPKNQLPSGTRLFPENTSLGKNPQASITTKGNTPVPKKTKFQKTHITDLF